MPGNSASRWAAITCSSGTKRELPGHGDEAGQQRRHLDPGEALLAGARRRGRRRRGSATGSRCTGTGATGSTASGVSTGKMRSSNSRVSCARASSSRSCQSTNSTPASCERGRDVLGEHRGLQRDELLDPLADRAELLDLVDALGRRRADAGLELLLQARDAHLEELVEVRAEDREELRALEQRQRRVLREREHARVELEPRELAVEVAGLVGRAVVGVRGACPNGRRAPRRLPTPAPHGPDQGRVGCGHERRSSLTAPARVDDVPAVRAARARVRDRRRG